MRVKTVRQHINGHKPQALKNIGRKYEVTAAEAVNLIGSGVVVEDKPNGDDL